MKKRQRMQFHKKRTIRQQKQAEKRLVRSVERRLMMSKKHMFMGIDYAARDSRSTSMAYSFAVHYGKSYFIDSIRDAVLKVSKEMMSHFNELAKSFRLVALG